MPEPPTGPRRRVLRLAPEPGVGAHGRIPRWSGRGSSNGSVTGGDSVPHHKARDRTETRDWRYTVIRGTRAFVLQYHDVLAQRGGPSGFRTATARGYHLSEHTFRRHLEAIAGARPEGPSIFREAADVRVPGAPFALTFDDGGVSARLVADILEERDWRGCFFVATRFMGGEGFLDAQEIADLARRGHIIGSHSHSHPVMMGRLDPRLLREEWATSVAILEDITGQAVTVASVPGGGISRAVGGEAASAGIKLLFTSVPSGHGSVWEGCLVHGRYGLRARDRETTAAAIVRGDLGPRLARAAAWNARGVGKRLLGRSYLRIREALAR
jgi:peptidoglycan/xylan/chitin deacetylase (PgdA/CDA1 family)